MTLFQKETYDFKEPTHSCIIYGLATISRLFKIIGLFCRISSLLYGSFAKQTCDFKEPTNRSHPIVLLRLPTPVSYSAKEPYKRDDILQKRPMILKSLLYKQKR